MKETETKPIFIGEIKTQSPFGYKSPHSFIKLAELAIEKADWISVHTNALWGGDYNAISFVRNLTDKPILAKGFHHTDDDIQMALDHGADYVLTLNQDRIFNRHKDRLLFELSLIQTRNIRSFYKERMGNNYFDKLKFVFNGRNIKNGQKRGMSKYDDYRELCPWVCGASLIKKPEDVKMYYPNCDAFIAGENLVEYCEGLS